MTRKLIPAKRIVHCREIPVGHVQPTQDDHHDSAGNDEGETSEDAAQESSFQVADVDCQLQGFGAWQHVTKAHDMNEAFIREPTPTLYHVVVHHRDLSDGAADVDEAEHQEV